MQTTRKETEPTECTGITINRDEIVAQAESNRYDRHGARALLEGEGGSENPPHWITHRERTVNQFKQWLWEHREKNAPFNPEHSWSRKKANERYVRALDVDRYVQQEHEKFSTIHIVRTADGNPEPLAEQTKALTPDRYYQARYRQLKRLSAKYAAVETRAPKFPDDAESEVRSHVHTAVWVPGRVEEEEFDRLEEKLEEKHDAVVKGSTDCDVSVKHHSSPYNHGHTNDLDEERGSTTALPREIASHNHPLIRTRTDAMDLHDDRVVRWCAMLSAGSDGLHDTQGVRCWQTLGNFKSYANKMHELRESST